MSNIDCRNNVPTVPVSPLVGTGVAFMQTNAQTWANEAVGLAQALENFSATPLAFTPPTFPALHFESFIKPGLPGEYIPPDNLAHPVAPARVALTPAEFVSPDKPTITLEDFDIERPDFEALLPPYLENNYYADVDTRRAQALTELRSSDVDGQAVRARWNEMILGGTGLPIPIEQALFDRGIWREDMVSQQAINQAHQEWAARGFTLPGSTLLARVSEVRNTNRMARAGTNRELTIQYHEKEIENMRFAVQQGVALEGQWAAQFTQTYDLAKQTADGYYRVAVAVLEAQVSYLRARIDVYQADIQAFRDRVQIELAKLDIFRAEIEAQRLIGEINKLEVDMYLGRIQAVLAGVNVFRAEIDAFRAEIDAEVAQITGFRAQVEAYSALLQTDRITADVFTARVGAEEAKVRAYSAEVQAFAERVRAYSAEVQAESSRVDAVTRIDEAKVRQYVAETEGWATQMRVDIERIRTALGVFEAETGRYNAELSAESARVQGESRNTEIAANRTNAEVAAALKRADQQLEQMRHITSLALASLEGAARTYSQLTGAALSAVNLSAGISQGFTSSESKSCSLSYNYSGDT